MRVMPRPYRPSPFASRRIKFYVTGTPPELPTGTPARGRHQAKVHLVILVVEERPLPPVAALRDMVRDARGHHSCDSGHAPTLSPRPPRVKVN